MYTSNKCIYFDKHLYPFWLLLKMPIEIHLELSSLNSKWVRSLNFYVYILFSNTNSSTCSKYSHITAFWNSQLEI